MMVREKMPSPPFGERCDCGHLAFVHESGRGACLANVESDRFGQVRRCLCEHSSVEDIRGAKYA